MASRNPQGIHRLSATAVKCIDKPGWHCDGGGLYLEVDANGRKRWAMRLVVNGRRRDFGLGPIHKISLAEPADPTCHIISVRFACYHEAARHFDAMLARNRLRLLLVEGKHRSAGPRSGIPPNE
jgi:hypothetical protein